MEPEPKSQTGGAEPDASSMSAAVNGLNQLLGDEATLAAARGISEEALDSIYGVARKLYANGHHAEALKSFELLCLYDHENARNWHALGICRQVTEDYAGAAAALTVAAGQLGDPGPDLKLSLAECLIGFGALDAAGNVLAELAEGADALSETDLGKVRFLESRLTELGRKA